MTATNTISNEWLQFIEFIKRKYGYNSSEYIRINDYNISEGKSVANYYKAKNPSLDIRGDEDLSNLLKQASFKNLLDLDHPVTISKFTEIYNDTDYLMRGLNTTGGGNLYIKCNPVDVDSSGVATQVSTSTTMNAIIGDGAAALALEKIYDNEGFWVLISILSFFVLIFIFRFFTYHYPNMSIKNIASVSPKQDSVG